MGHAGQFEGLKFFNDNRVFQTILDRWKSSVRFVDPDSLYDACIEKLCTVNHIFDRHNLTERNGM
ncbi:hypothetical protein D0469_02505 [Peribacillus saganii]|uniref:Uncharacterized protein n=1 Tax=Peribacillus saganii TaxID=2303992 RepID=A0A372LSM1_9BACI|nr:hypothetical protein D0469_02505 [Peribacillus saganii]